MRGVHARVSPEFKKFLKKIQEEYKETYGKQVSINDLTRDIYNNRQFVKPLFFYDNIRKQFEDSIRKRRFKENVRTNLGI